jgi:acetoin utilization deacetylase AcuC-like enzyme
MNPLLNSQIDYIQDHEIQVTTEFDKASLDFLSRVHSAEYLTFVNKLSKELEKRNQTATNENPTSTPSIVPFTPMVSYPKYLLLIFLMGFCVTNIPLSSS